MRNYLLPILLSCCIRLAAQQAAPKDLQSLPGYSFAVWYSPGAQPKAENMARQVEAVMGYYDGLLHFRPKVRLLILSEAQWKAHTSFPVYGMPHYNDRETLIVASEDNVFWKSFIPEEDKIPEAHRETFRQAYRNGKGSLSMEPFFDLLAIHELGHAYHAQDSLQIQRLWMGELYANILLHTWVAEQSPAYLPALTVLPSISLETIPRSSLRFTSLQELEDNYDLIGRQYPNNYGWYQFRWHVAAGNIYDAGGPAALQKLRIALKTERRKLDDPALSTLLLGQVHPAVADVMLKWD